MPSPVANRSIYGGNAPSDGIKTGTTFRSRHVAARNITSLQLMYLNAAGISDAGLNAVNHKASIEYPVGVATTPVLFGGVRTIAMAAGTKAMSDVVNIAIPAGAVFYVRTYVSCAAGDKWVALATQDATSWGEGLTANADVVDSVAAMTTSSDASYLIAPIAITNGDAGVPSVVIYGDSILRGTGETGFFDRGYMMRACNRGILGAAVPFINLAYPGETVQAFLAGGALRKTIPAAISCRIAVVGFGTNDITAGRTAAQVQADLTSLYALLVGLGLSVWAVTLLPRTTSTDAWATTVNQTPLAGFATGGVRSSVNAWLRALPANVSGIIDAADVVESARDSGVWRAAGLTADGTHPNTTGHKAIANIVPLSLFSITSLTNQSVG